MADSRTDRLDEAQALGLQGHYDAAFEILQELLQEASTDVASLRLKGNLLELKAMDTLENSKKKLTSSVDYVAARGCYEKILEIDSRNVLARIDLGDHYRNLEANDKALEYYREASNALRGAPDAPHWKEYVRDLLVGVELLAKHDRLAREASLLEAWCRQALSIPD